MLAAKLLRTATRQPRPQISLLALARTTSPFLHSSRALHSSRPALASSFDDSGMPRLQDTPVNIVRRRAYGTDLSRIIMFLCVLLW
jgi:hypothetical protein